jgi:hypothetical protein
MSHVIKAGFMGEERTIILEIGRRYEVRPMNIAKGKNVGRTCTLLALNEDFMPSEAEVKWEDTGRKGKIKDLTDLILLDD